MHSTAIISRIAILSLPGWNEAIFSVTTSYYLHGQASMSRNFGYPVSRFWVPV